MCLLSKMKYQIFTKRLVYDVERSEVPEAPVGSPTPAPSVAPIAAEATQAQVVRTREAGVDAGKAAAQEQAGSTPDTSIEEAPTNNALAAPTDNALADAAATESADNQADSTSGNQSNQPASKEEGGMLAGFGAMFSKASELFGKIMESWEKVSSKFGDIWDQISGKIDAEMQKQGVDLGISDNAENTSPPSGPAKEKIDSMISAFTENITITKVDLQGKNIAEVFGTKDLTADQLFAVLHKQQCTPDTTISNFNNVKPGDVIFFKAPESTDSSAPKTQNASLVTKVDTTTGTITYIDMTAGNGTEKQIQLSSSEKGNIFAIMHLSQGLRGQVKTAATPSQAQATTETSE